MRLSLTLLVIAVIQASEFAISQDVSNLKSDERVVFFTTDATLSDDQRHWNVPIHAWVYELDNARIRRKTVSAALKLKYRLSTTADTQANFDQRVRLIVADNESGKRIVTSIAGQHFTLPPTASNGHTFAVVQLDAALAAQHVIAGQLRYTAVLKDGDNRAFTGKTNLIAGAGISVISDLDDTVKITHVTDRAKMLEQSLYGIFQPVPGMARLYSAWAKQGVTFHFVSSSPWHLYEPIDQFLNDTGFPSRSMSLKQFRFKDATLLNLFKSGLETKPAQIKPIMDAYPNRRFVLIGDSGEQDPEVYAAVCKQHPDRIARIYIRNVTGEKPDNERFSRVFEGIDAAKWMLFNDANELELPE